MRERLEENCVPEPNTGCWLWIGAVNKGGYGTLSVSGRTRLAHRESYRAFVAPLSALPLDHKCRQRACVNPDHLRPMTGRENTLIGDGPTAMNAAKTACLNGHSLDKAYLDGSSRRCRACKAARMRASRASRSGH